MGPSWGRSAGLAVIHGKRAQHLVRLHKYGSRPAGTEPIGLGHASVRLPERILENVGDHNGFSAVHGRAAGSRLRSDAKAVDGLGIGLGKAGAGAVPHVLPVLVKEQYRAQQAGQLVFHNPYQLLQYFPQRSIARYHLQDTTLSVAHRLGPLAFAHIHDRADDFSDFARLIHHRTIDTMKEFYRSVRQNDPQISLRIHPSLLRGLHFRSLLDLWSILGVHPFEELRPGGRVFLGFIVINAKNLLRPEETVGTHIPSPTAYVC